MIASLAAFLGVSALVIMTPGPDTAVTISATVSTGRRGGVHAAMGVFCGQATWTVATSAGLSALLVASEPAFRAVKYAGACYLVVIGLMAISAAIRHKTVTPDVRPETPRRHAGRWLRRGLLSDLGNPKMAVFFTSLLPQFGSRFLVVTLLGLVFCAMTFGWLVCYTLAVARMGTILRRPPIRRALDAVTGAVLVALGVRVAVEPR